MRNQVQAINWKNSQIFKRKEKAIFFITCVMFPFIGGGYVFLLQNDESFLEIKAPLLFLLPIFELNIVYFFLPVIFEKLQKQQDVQKIMGLSSLALEYSLLITNTFKILSVVFFRCLCSMILSFFYESDRIEILFSIFLYEITQLCFCQSIKMVKINSAIKVLLVFGNMYSLFFCLILKPDTQNSNFLYIACIFPTFTYYIKPYLQINEQRIIQYHTQNSFQKNYYYCLYANLFFYSLLAFLSFYFKYFRKQNKNLQLLLPALQQPLNDQNSTYIQDTSSAIIHQNILNQSVTNFQNMAIQISNLSKQFQKITAVDKISLQIYKSQILCLLGHNGAGKSTLISLLTGQISKDQGEILFNGKCLEDNQNQIYSKMGYCPQDNVLYEDLTVFEHLKYYGKIKGLKDNEDLQEQIHYILQSCNLELEKDKFAKHLSQGNKRKLCLGIAMIGRPDIIILDEPTQGMDLKERAKIWNILLQMKNEGKCLILTTHHLDEAEVLSERVAIMAKGKLLTVGSVDFVKKHFGIGYHLNIYNLTNNQYIWEDKMEKIKSLVINQIQESKLEPQTANECISFGIPFDCKNKLLSIFEILENDNSIQINLMINTLEEAFINIGMDEEAFLKKAQNGSMIEDQVEVNINDEFAKIIPPNCLKNDPQFSFYLQFKACFFISYYCGKGILIIVFIVQIILIMFTLKFLNKFQDQKEEDNSKNEVNYLFKFLFVFFTESYLSQFQLQDGKTKYRHTLYYMGLHVWIYWISNVLINYLLLSVVFLIYPLSYFITKLTMINITEALFTLMSYTTLCNWIQLFFPSTNYGQVLQRLLIFILFIASIGVAYITKTWLSSLNWLCIIIPQLILFREVSFKEYLKLYTKIEWIDSLFILILIFQTILYLCLAVAIDHRQLLASKQQANLVGSNDNDVIEESRRVQDNNCQDKVIAKQISKTYQNGFQALKGTSFGVESGQIFGLLGPNGAGKSTTFNMITCRLKPTTGIIKLMGQEIDKGKGEIFQNVGICPQFEYLHPWMTVRQHLKILALIKGLDKNDAEEAINYLMKIMLLTEYENRKVQQLSVGTKKKLQVALALMGGNRILYFDEPSSSMDPLARNQYKQSIQNAVKCRNSAVLLTTHLMAEAEQICTKIAIQAHGEFQCIGGVNYLLKKFGKGYRINVELENDVDPSKVEICIKQQYPDSEILQKDRQLEFELPKEISFYETFKFFLNLIEQPEKLIKDFQIYQPSLESVFLKFAVQQEQIDKENLNKQKLCQCFCCNDDEVD